MIDITRRDAVRLWAASLVSGSGALALGAAEDRAGEIEANKQLTAAPADPNAEDSALKNAIEHPQSFMFLEQVTFQLQGDRYSRDLYFTSARNSGKKGLRVPIGSMRIFRADPDVDEFTKSGGIYWKSFNTDGKLQFKQPGALVMAVRQRDDTVHCYTLMPDLRC